MARYKAYDYSQMTMVPVILEEQLEPGTLEYAIHHIVEDHLNLSIFTNRYNNDITGRIAIDPKVLLKIVLIGYSRGIISSRQLERACKQNIIFMAMSCGETPDHSTIATFVLTMREAITPIFTQILLICEEEGLLGGTHFSIDGVKLPSNASKEWSRKIDDLREKKDKIEKKIEKILKEHKEEDRKEEVKEENKVKSNEKRLERLKKKSEKIKKF
jgi:transposase